MPTKKRRKKENVEYQPVVLIGGEASDSTNEIQQMIEECCKYIKQQHGADWRESFFQKSLAFELQQRGYEVSMEVSHPVYYKSTTGKKTSVGNIFLDILTPDFAIECKIEKMRDTAVQQAKLYSSIIGKPCFLAFC